MTQEQLDATRPTCSLCGHHGTTLRGICGRCLGTARKQQRREQDIAQEQELTRLREENARLRAALRNAHEASEDLYAFTGGQAR